MSHIDQEKTPINNLQAALEYSDQGYSVIPVGIDKKPLIQWKEYQTKCANKKIITSWFQTWPMANISIVTGKISGIVVVDVENGGTIDDLPKTVMSQTGGGGWHLYYQYDPNRPVGNFGRIRDLTDIRGDGGYVIAPPSLHKSGKQYAWLTPMDRDALSEFPYWLLDTPSAVCAESAQRSQAIAASVHKGARNGTATKEAGKILQGLKPSLWGSIGWSGFSAWNANICKPPLDERELLAVWNSIVKRQEEKRSKNEKERINKENTAEIYWSRPRDGRIIEAYYDPSGAETGLLVYEEEKITKTAHVVIGGLTYTAPPPTNNLVKPGFIKLPSEALAFDSEISLLAEVKAFIHYYVQIPTDFEDLAAFYVLFSWVYDHFQELPYFRVIGDYGSGKSRFLKVMGALCCRSIFLNGSTSASAMFRMMDQVKGTIILDEADFRFSDTSNEIVKILNSGFQKGIPVFRSEASGKNMKSYDPTPFDVFGPKIIATRKDFIDDALESRCLSNPMEAMTREDIPENLEDEFEERALQIRNKLVMFRFKKLRSGISKEPLPKLNAEPRLRQIIAPLYRVIDDPVGKDIILNFIRGKQQELIDRRFGSLEGELLQSIVNVLVMNPEPTMKDIAVAYNSTFGGKYDIKPKKVGSILQQTFHLERRKGAKGIYLCSGSENEERIEKLKLKFGLLEPKMNIVHDVNIVERWDIVRATEEIFGVKAISIVDNSNSPHP